MNKKNDFSRVLVCLHCGNKTKMDRVSSYEHAYEDFTADDYGDLIPVYIEYAQFDLYNCPSCDKVMLVRLDWSPFNVLPSGDPITDETILFPHVVSTAKAIPPSVNSAFESALKIRHIDGAVCALALRRTLEMMCKERGQTKGTLYEKLENLSKAGIIPPILDGMADVLREFGNSAAHADDTTFDPSLVESLVEFTTTILDYVYVLPRKLEALQRRMQGATEVAETK